MFQQLCCQKQFAKISMMARRSVWCPDLRNFARMSSMYSITTLSLFLIAIGQLLSNLSSHQRPSVLGYLHLRNCHVECLKFLIPLKVIQNLQIHFQSMMKKMVRGSLQLLIPIFQSITRLSIFGITLVEV